MSENDWSMKPLKPEVSGAIKKVVDKAPNDPTMSNLQQHLNRAARAAASGNKNEMERAIKTAQGPSTALGARKIDVLVEVDEAIRKIRESAR